MTAAASRLAEEGCMYAALLGVGTDICTICSFDYNMLAVLTSTGKIMLARQYMHARDAWIQECMPLHILGTVPAS